MKVKLNAGADLAGGCLQGALTRTHASRAKMVAALGAPHCDGTEKTAAEWYFETPVGGASIYDWKQTNRSDEEPIDWYVGGSSRVAVEYVEDFVIERLRAVWRS
jgi:hypothetical protein